MNLLAKHIISLKQNKVKRKGLCQAKHLTTLVVIVLLEELLVDELPEDREHQTLHTVGQDLGLQATAEQTAQTVLLDDAAEGLGVRDLLSVTLLVHLDHADRVGAGVRHGRGAETDHGTTSQLLGGLVVARQHLVEVVVHEEPRVVTHESCGGGSDGTLEESAGASSSELSHELLHTVLTLHLPMNLKIFKRMSK